MIKKILVTGAAGFIGFHLSWRLHQEKYGIVGLDNLSTYYDVQLKKDRLKQLQAVGICFFQEDIVNLKALFALFEKERFSHVVHLAAQAGIRYSIDNPQAYIDSNVVGFFNVLQACRHFSVEHLIYASSSSVYGGNEKLPFSVEDPVDRPLSLYAATKKSNELMAHAYAHLYRVPMTGLRFFTVYGPWGRPDMAMFKFTDAIFEGKPIQLYNNGQHYRDFTYVDDIVESIVRLMDCMPESDKAPYQIYNIGYGHPVGLLDCIHLIEKHAGKKAIIEFLPAQAGDMENTHADTSALQERIHFSPIVSIDEGVKRFVEWYRGYT